MEETKVIAKLGTGPFGTGPLSRAETLEQFFNLALGIFVIGGFDGYIKEISPGAERVLGFTPSEFKARPFLDFIHPDDRAEAEKELGELKTIHESSGFVNRCKCKDGSYKWISWSSRGIPEEQLIFAVGHDITEHRKLDQARNVFANFISHQLKAPLFEMKGYLENMMGGLAGFLSPKLIEYVQKMEHINLRNIRLISNILNISKLDRGMISIDLQPVDLNAAVRLALEEYADSIRKKGLNLILERSSNEVWVVADLDRLVEALKNLLNNAEKFTEKGSITLNIWSDTHFGIVEITDTGTGIRDDDFSELFSKELGFSDAPRPKGGSGLGLYITRSLLELQGGTVQAKRLPGAGAQFIVKLPKSETHRRQK